MCPLRLSWLFSIESNSDCYNEQSSNGGKGGPRQHKAKIMSIAPIKTVTKQELREMYPATIKDTDKDKEALRALKTQVCELMCKSDVSLEDMGKELGMSRQAFHNFMTKADAGLKDEHLIKLEIWLSRNG